MKYEQFEVLFFFKKTIISINSGYKFSNTMSLNK